MIRSSLPMRVAIAGDVTLPHVPYSPLTTPPVPGWSYSWPGSHGTSCLYLYKTNITFNRSRGLHSKNTTNLIYRRYKWNGIRLLRWIREMWGRRIYANVSCWLFLKNFRLRLLCVRMPYIRKWKLSTVFLQDIQQNNSLSNFFQNDNNVIVLTRNKKSSTTGR